MKNKFIFILKVCFIVNICCFSKAKSQNVTYSSDFPEIAQSAFYKLALSPDLVSKTGNKFNRIRIYDGVNEIPFLLKRNALSVSTTQFHQLPILRKVREDSLESIVFGNPDSVKLMNIVISLKRAWTTKKVKVSGSSDGKTWYVVRSEFLMHLTNISNGNNETEISHTLNLPLTNYRFYKIECNNKNDLSVNVLAIGYFSSLQTAQNMIMLPKPKVEIIKTDNKSLDLFRVTFDAHYLVDRLVFNISQPHFFYRNANLYTRNPMQKNSYKNNRNDPKTGLLNSFILSSKDSLNSLDIHDQFSNRFFVLVENDDNPSLDIKSVDGYYHQYYIKTYLESGKKYSLTIGSDSLNFPTYDLSNFDSPTDDEVALVSLMPFQKKQTLIKSVQEPFFKSKLWVGLGLFFVGVILIYACVQMMQDIKP